MARVQCFECDMPVVVDPRGRCPEGHDLGPVGERIEQSLGRADPHPDEPEPWVAVVDPEPEAQPSVAHEPRVPRPISVGPDESSDDLDASGADGLLQELHSLHGLNAVGSDDSDIPMSEPATSPDPDPAASAGEAGPEAEEPLRRQEPAPRRVPTVRSDEDLSAIAELAALLGDDPGSPAPVAPPEPTESSRPVDQPRSAPVPSAAPPAASSSLPRWPDTDPPPPSTAPSPEASQAPPRVDPDAASSRAASPVAPGLDDPSDPPAPRDAFTDPDSPSAPVASPAEPGLASVSRLPVRGTIPSDDGDADAELADDDPDERSGRVAASGESIDLTNFTAKGKKRRFGR